MSVRLEDITRYDLSLYAVIDSGVRIENVAAFQSNFAINTIPSATISIAKGFVVKGSPKLLDGEEWDNQSTGRAIEVWAKYKDPDKPGFSKHVLLFAGETAGHSITKNAQSVTYNITIRHWLAWLNEGSVYSPNLAPGSADNASFPATAPELRIRALDGGVNTSAGSLVPKITSDGGTAAAFLADVWGSLIRPFLDYIAKENPLHRDLTGQTVADVRAGTLAMTRLQKRVIYALQQVWGSKDALPFSTLVQTARNAPSFQFPNAGLPFRIRDAAGTRRINEDFLVGQFADFLLQRDAAQLSNNTVWGKLIGEYCPTLLAEIWPHVEFARIVPSVGSIRNLSNQYPTDEKTVTLPAKDIFQIDLVADVARDIRSVLILRPEFSFSNAPTQGPATDTTAANYATFVGQETGLVLVRQAPQWLVMANISAGGAGQQEPGDGGPAQATPVVASMDEVDPVATEKLKKAKEEAAKQQTELRGLADSYAQQLYNNEILRGRQVQLSCPFLSHICPGAPIRFEATIETVAAPEEADEEVRERPRNVFLGKVVQMSNVIDIARKTVGTTLLLGHVRTEYEDSLPKFTTTIPPVYTHNMTVWPMSLYHNEETASVPDALYPPFFWETKGDKNNELFSLDDSVDRALRSATART